MVFENLLTRIQPPLVHAKPDVARINPDGRPARDGRDRQSRREAESDEDSGNPVPNALGQLTGKLIDTTA